MAELEVPAEVVEEEEILYEDEFVTIWPDGFADFRIKSAEEARLVIKTLKLLIKQLRLAMRETNASLRDVRHQYTNYTQQRGSMIRGGGKIGQFVRIVQTVARDYQRAEMANSVQPLHEQKQRLEQAITTLDQHILRIEAVLLRMEIG